MKATINTIITPGFSLQKMLTLANLAVTAYDVATTIRMVFCGEATVLDVALCIVKGLVVQSLISCVATAVFGEAAAFMLKLVGIGQDTYGLIEAIKSKEPEEIVIATVRLAVSVFTLKSQCFAGDTLVSTEEGNRRIDEIKPGDKVLSYNTETGENELQEVKNVSVSKTDILVHIITDDGRDIETTMFHPFYVKNEDGTGEWKAASNLKAGDELLSEDGKKVKISEVKVEKLAEEITVYNLELDEVHTYYVAGGVLVHNRCGTSNASDSGSGSNKIDYKKVFFEQKPELEGKVVVHHSIEQQVIKRYPGLFPAEEINAYDMLRGIPKDINSKVHLSDIRIEWNNFYKKVDAGEIALTKENFLNKALEIDKLFGSQFQPPR